MSMEYMLAAFLLHKNHILIHGGLEYHIPEALKYNEIPIHIKSWFKIVLRECGCTTNIKHTEEQFEKHLEMAWYLNEWISNYLAEET
jgi:hypothetical protein